MGKKEEKDKMPLKYADIEFDVHSGFQHSNLIIENCDEVRIEGSVMIFYVNNVQIRVFQQNDIKMVKFVDKTGEIEET